MWGVLPANPIFYLLVAASYCTMPATEFVIFRRWWPIRPAAIAIFSKKRVLNEAILGYSGDAYLFLWARRALSTHHLAARPLAAVKDVAITSALAGNAATLLLLGMALLFGGGPAVGQAFEGAAMRPIVFGFLFVISISLAILLFGKKVLSLSFRENALLVGYHSLRLVVSSILLLLAWTMALPGIAIGTWIVLGGLRMVVTRLPFVPNKEVLFAAVGVTLTGGAAPAVAALMAASGALHLASHAASYLLASMIDHRWNGSMTEPAAAIA